MATVVTLVSSSASRLLSAAAAIAAMRRSSLAGSVGTGCPEAEDDGPEAELSDRVREVEMPEDARVREEEGWAVWLGGEK